MNQPRKPHGSPSGGEYDYKTNRDSQVNLESGYREYEPSARVLMNIKEKGAIVSEVEHLKDVQPLIIDIDNPLEQLPDSWRDTLSPIEIKITSNEITYNALWTPEGVRLEGVDIRAEEVMTAISDDENLGLSLIRDMESSESLFADRPYSSSSLMNNSYYDKYYDYLYRYRYLPEEIKMRMDKSFITRTIIEAATKEWMKGLGISYDESPLIEVSVSHCFPDLNEDKSLGDNNGHIVGAYGMFGADSKTRIVICVSDDWYDDARDNGIIINGRLNLGTLDGERVLADITSDEQSGLGIIRSINDDGNLKELNRALILNHLKVSESNVKTDISDGLVDKEGAPSMVIGSQIIMDYNDEQYYSTGGRLPKYLFARHKDSLCWCNFNNYLGTFARSDLLTEYECTDPTIDPAWEIEKKNKTELIKMINKSQSNNPEPLLPFVRLDRVEISQ